MTTYAALQSFRRAERRWKKDKLQVFFFFILRDSSLKYQKVLRAARSGHFTKLITKNYRPTTLFTVFNAVINACVYEYSVVSKTLCDDFQFFL